MFDLSLEDLDVTSSVGLSSMRRFGTTIGEALGYTGLLKDLRFSAERVAIFRSLVRQRFESRDPDPIRVFVKPEPHKEEKIQEGRFRLISAVGMTDAMLDRIMYGWLGAQVLSTVGRTPILIGWSPLGGGARLMTSLFSGKKTRGLDKRAWDWSIMPEMLLFLRDFIETLAIGAPQWWLDWHRDRWEKLFRDAVLEFGDGMQVRQPGWGVMKSGCYLTIILNSIAQLVYHVVVCRALGLDPFSLDLAVIGDDETIENFEQFAAYEREMRKRRALLKDSEPSEVIQFAGFCFYQDPQYGSYALPEYWQKHVFAITHAPEDKLVDMLRSYQLLYAYEPGFLKWIQMLMAKLSPEDVRSAPVLRLQFSS